MEYANLFGSMGAVPSLRPRLVDTWADAITGPVIDAGCGPGQWTNWVAVVEDGVISEFGLDERHGRSREFARRTLGLLAREGLTAEPETPHQAQGR